MAIQDKQVIFWMMVLRELKYLVMDILMEKEWAHGMHIMKMELSKTNMNMAIMNVENS